MAKSKKMRTKKQMFENIPPKGTHLVANCVPSEAVPTCKDDVNGIPTATNDPNSIN